MKSRVHARSLRLLGLPWLLVGIGCSSQGGAQSPPDLLGTPVQDMAQDGMTSSDLKSEQSFFWIKQAPNSDNVDTLRQIAVDKAGNVFVGCQFGGQADFGDGPRASHGNHDIALLKYTAAGDLVWVRQLGTAQAEYLLRLAVDPSGNVIIVGSFTDPLDVGGNVLTSHGSDDYFLAKYDGNGAVLWAKAIGSTQVERSAAGLAIDDSGNIYLGAEFNLGGTSGSIDVGGGPLVSAGYSDGFVAKFDPGGAHVFSKRLGGPYIDEIRTVTLDKNGDILIGGQLMGPVDLGGGKMDPGAPATRWAFIERLDAKGVHKWATGFYSDGSRVTDLAIDDSGAVAASGIFIHALQTRTASLSSSDDNEHGFLLQIDATNSEKWARVVAVGSSNDYAMALSVFGNGILLGGSFRDGGDFGFGAHPVKGTIDGYLVAYNTMGMPQWMRQIGGSDDDWVGAIARTADAFYIGGEFSSAVDFGGTTLTSKGFSDGFIMRLPPMSPTTP